MYNTNGQSENASQGSHVGFNSKNCIIFNYRYHHSLKRFCLMSIFLRIVAGDFYNVEISMQVKE